MIMTITAKLGRKEYFKWKSLFALEFWESCISQCHSSIHPVCQQLVLPPRLSQHLLFPLPTITKSYVARTTAGSLDHQKSCQVMLPRHLDPPAALTTSRRKHELSGVSCWSWPLTLPCNALTLFAFESVSLSHQVMLQPTHFCMAVPPGITSL